MAASNAPKHDFAPSWLKIPNPNENTRPVGSRNSHAQDHSRQRHDDGYYNRYNGDYPRPLNRQNSFDMYDGSRRYSPSHVSKFRHHSMEDDYYMNYYNYAPYPLGYNDRYPMQFRSQPSIPRQDMKYPPASSSRFGQVNGSYNGFGPFCDFYPPGEGFNSYGSGGHGAKRSHYARDGRTESRESRDSDRSQRDGGEEKDKIFNDDFPSLNGTDEDGDVKTSKNTSSGGVWDNPPKSKVEESPDAKNSTPGSSLYKVVPTKAGSARKNSRDGIRVNGSVREGSPLAAVKPKPNREVLQQSPTQSMEVLSTCLARPKPADKKSEFLKALREVADPDGNLQNGQLSDQESSNCEAKKEEVEEGETEVAKDDVDEEQLQRDRNHSLDGDSQILSSTEEEELMFMRSLGWDETAETQEITEDEKREFLKKRMIQQQRKGEIRAQIKLWLSQPIKPSSPPQPAQDIDETLSSSDTDSDDDA